MIRSFALTFGVLLALPAAQASGAVEVFPVVHNEPITIRVLSGKTGLPLIHARLLLVAGYDRRDLRLRMWRGEAFTGLDGNARLPDALANLPFLQIRLARKHLCQADSSAATYSVERIRRDGLSTPDRCGFAAVEDAPGIFIVYAKGKGAAKTRFSSASHAAAATAAQKN
ncbi:MAG: hypothetical protein ABR924_04440 [Terracidiphilus sp.]|jgi:hypothetical protein